MFIFAIYYICLPLSSGARFMPTFIPLITSQGVDRCSFVTMALCFVGAAGTGVTNADTMTMSPAVVPRVRSLCRSTPSRRRSRCWCLSAPTCFHPFHVGCCFSHRIVKPGRYARWWYDRRRYDRRRYDCWRYDQRRVNRREGDRRRYNRWLDNRRRCDRWRDNRRRVDRQDGDRRRYDCW